MNKHSTLNSHRYLTRANEGTVNVSNMHYFEPQTLHVYYFEPQILHCYTILELTQLPRHVTAANDEAVPGHSPLELQVGRGNR